MNGENPYTSSTLQANWYEDRYFPGSSKKPVEFVRPEYDEVENIPRIKRYHKPTGEVFQPDHVDPEEQYKTVSRETYVNFAAGEKTVQNQTRSRGLSDIVPQEESVTQRRMNATPEQIQAILDFETNEFIPNYSLPPVTPEEQFTTTYNSTFKRFI